MNQYLQYLLLFLIGGFTLTGIKYASEYVSPIMAGIIGALPIGLFSTYFLVSGLRSLRFKQKEFELKTDKIIAYLITLTGISMILYPIVLYSKLNIILTVFGVVGIVFGLRDLKLFQDIQRIKKNWLKLHLGKMTGGYIAAVSAFFVVNQILPGIWNWFVPGIIGSGYITYWMIKLNKKKSVANKV